jgi:hypothetical protein
VEVPDITLGLLPVSKNAVKNITSVSNSGQSGKVLIFQREKYG